MQPVVVVGDCSVGKTLLVRALCGGHGPGQLGGGSGSGSGSRGAGVAPPRPAATVGVHSQPCPVLGPSTLLWDCSGSSQSEVLRSAHVQRSCAMICVFDVTRRATFESALEQVVAGKQRRSVDRLGAVRFPVVLVGTVITAPQTAADDHDDHEGGRGGRGRRGGGGVRAVVVSEEEQRVRADRLNVTIVARVNLATGSGLPLLIRRLRAALNAQAVGTRDSGNCGNMHNSSGHGAGDCSISPYGWVKELGKMLLSSSCIGDCGAVLQDSLEGNGDDEEEERQLLRVRSASGVDRDRERGGSCAVDRGWGRSLPSAHTDKEEGDAEEEEDRGMTTMETLDDDNDEVSLDGMIPSHSRGHGSGRSRARGNGGEHASSSFLSSTAKALLATPTHAANGRYKLERDNQAVSVSTEVADRERQKRNALAISASNYYSMVDNDVFSPYFNT